MARPGRDARAGVVVGQAGRVAVDLLAGWLVEVAGDRLLRGAAEERVLRQALRDSIDVVVEQAAPELRDGLQRGLHGVLRTAG